MRNASQENYIPPASSESTPAAPRLLARRAAGYILELLQFYLFAPVPADFRGPCPATSLHRPETPTRQVSLRLSASASGSAAVRSALLTYLGRTGTRARR